MVIEIRDEWVKRLRSGDYPKGTLYLHDIKKGTYCVLGVLCEVAVDAGIVTRSEGGVYAGHEADSLWFAFPPPEMNEWAGLTLEQMVKISRENDNPSATFAEMADKIEREL